MAAQPVSGLAEATPQSVIRVLWPFRAVSDWISMQSEGSLRDNTGEAVSLGMSTPQKRGNRGPGFKIEESLALVRAWIAISHDPICGADQAGAKFWQRIWTQFAIEVGSKTDRTPHSLESHWGTLSKSVQKFAGLLNQLMNNLRSGENEVTAIEEAMKRYLILMKKPFKFMEPYKLLKPCPKFQLFEKSGTPSTTETKKDMNEPDTAFTTPERPIGQAAAKRRRKEGVAFNEGDLAESSIRIMQAAEKIAAAADERRRLAEERNMMLLFEQDPSAEESKEFFRLKRQQYLQKVKESMAANRN